MSADDRPGESRLNFHGRRRGHSLRRGRRERLETLLPALRVPLPGRPGALDPAALFPFAPADVWLEVGFGGGEHLAAQAAGHPEIGFIGCEPYVDGVAGLTTMVEEGGLANVRVFDDDARLLLPGLAEASIGRIYVLFSDPWPKRRHWKRRFPDDAAMAELERVVRPGGEFRFASDHMDYAAWFLERMLRRDAFEWTARRPGDWRRRPEDGHPTRYEAKAEAAGRHPAHLCFRRRG